MDCSLPGSSTHGIFQARILEWGAIESWVNFDCIFLFHGASQVALVVKEPTCQCRRCKRRGFNPWVGKILWRRKWQPTPVLLPGKSHGQRSLVGYSLWGREESDTTERLHFISYKNPRGRWDRLAQGNYGSDKLTVFPREH